MHQLPWNADTSSSYSVSSAYDILVGNNASVVVEDEKAANFLSFGKHKSLTKLEFLVRGVFTTRFQVRTNYVSGVF